MSRRLRRALGAGVVALALVAGVADTSPARPLRDEAPRRLLVGAAVNSAETLGEAPYAALLAREFSSGTPENHLKWQLVHPAPSTYDFADADAQLAFLEANGMAMRGHTLVWHRQNPSWLTGGGLTGPALRAVLDDHIDTVVGRYQGRIAQWDVVNEAIADTGGPRVTLWSQGLGFPGYLDRAFRRAAAADPSADLYYNDYGIEFPGPKFDAVVALVRGMLRRGVPIDGVGMQAHLPVGRCRAACTNRILANMVRLHRLGLDVAVTEADVAIPLPADDRELARQARVFRGVLRACLLAPNCTSFTVWGLTDAHSWIPFEFPGFGAALPFAADYRPKPAYAALDDTLRNPPRRPSCGDYRTRAEAQRALRRGILGAPLLDRDGDGRAC